MAFPKQTTYRNGQLSGVIYTFENPDDCLDEHSHSLEDQHNVIVMSGSIVLDVEGEFSIYSAGHVVDFDSTKKHKITALESGTIILNMQLQTTERKIEDVEAALEHQKQNQRLIEEAQRLGIPHSKPNW